MTQESKDTTEAMWEERLDQKRKEAELAVYFARQFIEELGKEKALEILGHAFEKYLEDVLSKRVEGVPLEKRMEKWGEQARQNAEEMPWFEVVTCTDKEVAVKMTRCTSHQIFAENGLTEVCQRYCDADFAVANVIHPNMRLIRTKSLAFGDCCCNHRWVLEGGD